MYSDQPFDPSESPSEDDLQSKKYSLRNFQHCEGLKKELIDVAIGRIFANLINALTSYKREEFFTARNRMEIPHGMFGLSLQDFYERRRGDVTFIDILKLACGNVLDMVKFAIVLDSLEDYVRRILKAHHSGRMGPIFKQIAASRKLLTIGDDIVTNFTKNMQKLSVLQDVIDNLHHRKREAYLNADDKFFDVQQEIVEEGIISGPIEIRYRANFYHRICDQVQYSLEKAENDHLKALDDLEMLKDQEHFGTSSVRMAQRVEIENIKNKLEMLSEKYDKDSEFYDGQISYKTLSTEMMKIHHKDCLDKLAFFAVDIVRLRDWHKEQKDKEHQEAVDLITQKTKKKPKEKKKKK